MPQPFTSKALKCLLRISFTIGYWITQVYCLCLKRDKLQPTKAV